ncbi:MAG: helix-turn-helix domain-containing protein, partial [Pseudomonadota bacterium]
MTGLEKLAAGGRNLRPAAEEDDLSLASTLMRGLAVLGCFQSGTEALGNAEIARRLDLNRATVSRLC